MKGTLPVGRLFAYSMVLCCVAARTTESCKAAIALHPVSSLPYSAQALPAGFLISNPNNTLRNNVAAGSTAGAGIWYQVRLEDKTHARQSVVGTVAFGRQFMVFKVSGTTLMTTMPPLPPSLAHPPSAAAALCYWPLCHQQRCLPPLHAHGRVHQQPRALQRPARAVGAPRVVSVVLGEWSGGLRVWRPGGSTA